ncbi:MAG: M48 family metallopeptidase [Methanobacteriaceae archaeon]|nr:M48 family metallopeptidase [Candidatus Methanorudis spinitermitis]
MRKYKLIKTKRKTITIKIKEDASLEVRAPLNMHGEKIDNFVKSKERWIAKHIGKIEENYKLKKQFELNFGDFVQLRGKQVAIQPTKGNIGSHNKEKNMFLIPEIANSNEIKDMTIKLYKLIAREYIRKRVQCFAHKMNVNPSAIRITSAKTRWGSCSGKNSVNFSWKLIMADNEVIDYVIVHELAHIKQHNHSSKFWKIVETIIPDYMEKKEKLKLLGKKLNKEDWSKQ